MENFFPYEVRNLAVGPIRAVVALRSALDNLPTKIQDVILMTNPYTLAEPYFEFGAGLNPASYSRGHTQSDLEIQQDTAAVDSEVTDVDKSQKWNAAELSPEGLAILEQSPGIETIEAEPGASAQKAVPFGAFTELDHYCAVLIGRRKKRAGLVTEPGGRTRSRMFGVVLYSAAITGDAQETSFPKGGLAGADITFKGYPDADAEAGIDYGRWLIEDEGTIEGS